MNAPRTTPAQMSEPQDSTQPQSGVRLIDTAAVAGMLGVSPRTVHDLTSTGRLPSLKIGRRRLIDLCDVVAFVEAAKREPQP